MEMHLGRLLDHVHLRTADLGASKAFYRALLRALGRNLTRDGPGFFSADELFVTPAEAGRVSRIHLAFQAPDRATVVAQQQHGIVLQLSARHARDEVRRD